jgi:hypothetical protein
MCVHSATGRGARSKLAAGGYKQALRRYRRLSHRQDVPYTAGKSLRLPSRTCVFSRMLRGSPSSAVSDVVIAVRVHMFTCRSCTSGDMAEGLSFKFTA